MGGIDVSDAQRESHLSVVLEAQQPPGCCGGMGSGRPLFHWLGQWLPVGLADEPAASGLVLRRRSEDGEDAAPHPALRHPRQVQMPSVAAAAQARVIFGGKRVVVSVEDGEHPRKLVPGRLGLSPAPPALLCS